MSLEIKPQHELLEILRAGAGVVVPASARPQRDLLALASAAKAAGSHLTLTDTTLLQQDDLVAIAMAGRGHVTIKY